MWMNDGYMDRLVDAQDDRWQVDGQIYKNKHINTEKDRDMVQTYNI